MSDSSRRPHPRCASCRSDDVRPVVSGLPTPELEELARRGEAELAGYRVSANTPRWACESCGAHFGSWAERRCDSVAIDACARAARDLTERQAGRPEAQLQEELAHAISNAASVSAGYQNVEVTTGRLKLTSGWFPLPGAIDIHVADPEHGQLDFIAELKVGAIEQQLWDALKLATGLLSELEGVRRAYLIAAADGERFEAGPVSELYAGPIGSWRRHDTTRLLRANEAAWRHDLRHGRGRPEWIPREIFTSLLGVWELERWGVQLRLVALEVADPDRVDMIEGCWPAVLGLKSVAYEAPRASTSADVDTTTALPNFRSGRQTDVWLAARIPDMPDDEFAEFCQYIKVTKDWKPREIRDRVEIHRRPSGER